MSSTVAVLGQGVGAAPEEGGGKVGRAALRGEHEGRDAVAVLRRRCEWAKGGEGCRGGEDEEVEAGWRSGWYTEGKEITRGGAGAEGGAGGRQKRWLATLEARVLLWHCPHTQHDMVEDSPSGPLPVRLRACHLDVDGGPKVEQQRGPRRAGSQGRGRQQRARPVLAPGVDVGAGRQEGSEDSWVVHPLC